MKRNPDEVNWLRRNTAFPVSNELLNKLKSPFRIGVTILVSILWLQVIVVCFLLKLWLGAVATALTLFALVPVALLVVAFKVKIKFKGQQYVPLVFEDVPAKMALMLRWRFADENKNGAEDYDPKKDKGLYRVFLSGLCLYSPLLFEREGLVDLKPQVLGQDPVQVNALDGQLIAIDTQVTGQVTDPVLFFLNAGNDQAGMAKIMKEYLHTALERMTSVRSDVKVPILNLDGTENDEIDGWDSETAGLTKASDLVQSRMGKFITGLLNHWLNGGSTDGGKGEQAFGFTVKIKVTALKPPPRFAAAQEAEASAKLQAKEAVTQSEGLATMLVNLQNAVQTLPDGMKERLTQIVADPNTNPDVLARALQLLTKGQGDTTILTAVATAAPMIRDILEIVMGGSRANENNPPTKPKGDEGETTTTGDRKK